MEGALVALIAVTGRRYPAAVTHPNDTAALDGQHLDAFFGAYGRSLAVLGATAVYVAREADVDAVVGGVDGVILGGGLDVDPTLYGGQATPRSTAHDRGQDDFDLALARAALAAEVPLLGTCRGHEVLNVALGGTLVDIDDRAHNARHAPATTTAHQVLLTEGSVLRGMYGPEAKVNSLHHQAVGALGEGLRAAARAADGVIEAIELDGRAAIGVQWHPEFLPGPEPVVQWLVDCARERAARRTRTHDHR